MLPKDRGARRSTANIKTVLHAQGSTNTYNRDSKYICVSIGEGSEFKHTLGNYEKSGIEKNNRVVQGCGIELSHIDSGTF